MLRILMLSDECEVIKDKLNTQHLALLIKSANFQIQIVIV
jgi:hypothetical protein